MVIDRNKSVVWTVVAAILWCLQSVNESEQQDFAAVSKLDTFVDKTAFIVDFFNTGSAGQNQSWPIVKVITGPKGWGKTTLVDALKRFLRIRVNAANGRPVTPERNPDRALFCGALPTAVCREGGALFRELFGRRPVAALSLAPLANATCAASYRRAVAEIVRRAYASHGYFLLEGVTPQLYSLAKQAFRRVARRAAVDETKYLPRLAEILHEHFGQAVVLLVDDYDSLGHRESFQSARHYDATAASLDRLVSAVLGSGHVSHALFTGERCARGAGLAHSLGRFPEHRFVGYNPSSRYRGFVRTLQIDGG